MGLLRSNTGSKDLNFMHYLFLRVSYSSVYGGRGLQRGIRQIFLGGDSIFKSHEMYEEPNIVCDKVAPLQTEEINFKGVII